VAATVSDDDTVTKGVWSAKDPTIADRAVRVATIMVGKSETCSRVPDKLVDYPDMSVESAELAAGDYVLSPACEFLTVEDEFGLASLIVRPYIAAPCVAGR
jgi:ERCC4-type nuclease